VELQCTNFTGGGSMEKIYQGDLLEIYKITEALGL
jgi:hypothetical protein